MGSLGGCAQGEAIDSDFKAVAKGHAGHGGSLAAGGSSGATAGSDVTTSGAGGSGGSDESIDSGSAGAVSVDSGMAGGAAYDGPLSAGLQVETLWQDPNTISFHVKITNNGTDAPPVSSLKVRYFLVADAISDASGVVFDYASWNSGSNMAPYNLAIKDACKATYAKLTPAKPMADSYLELGTDSGDSILNPKDYVEFQIRLAGAVDDPTNDYSYNAATTLTANDHVVVTQAGSVVAGMAP